MTKKDWWSKPFRTMVVLGESTVQGGGWIESEDYRWADVVAKLINSCQDEPVEYHNKGVSASVISPRSPGYEASAKPSAMEHYEEDVIALQPDLFILSFGLNDMRAGMNPEDFREEMAKIITDVKDRCDCLTVLTNVYHMTGFEWYAPFDRGGVGQTLVYNEVIRQLAERYECLYADVWSGEGEAEWVIHQDGVHANFVGNLLIAHRVFEVLANNCSGLSLRTRTKDEGTEWTKTADSMKYIENKY